MYLLSYLLPSQFSFCPFLSPKSSRENGSIYINMAYSEGTRYDAATNLRYFLKHGVTQIPSRNKVLYVKVVEVGVVWVVVAAWARVC